MLSILLMSTGPAVDASKIGIAATVDGQEITQLSLQNAIDDYLQQQGTNVASVRDPNRFNKIREKVLDVLIGQELLWQAASRDETIADDSEVTQAFKQFQARFENDASFTARLQAGGYNRDSFQQSLKQQLSVQKWIQKFVLKDITASDAEVHTFYLENKQQFFDPETIRARHILIKLEAGANDATRKEALDLLTGIKQEIDSGADFATLAKDKSQGPSAANGGDLGYFRRGQMVAPFENAAFALAPGEISGIVETRFGFHLIQLVDRKPAAQIEEQELAEEIRSHLIKEKYQHAVEDAVTRLKKGASIEKNTL